MVAELTALRDQIDVVDKALLDLLAKRLELVAEVGEVKSKYGLPIYVPEREASMLASRRKEAAAMGVPPDLIEDVLRRVMRESYSSENDKGFKTLCPSLRPVVIVGGGGQMGRLFEKMLGLSGYQVRTLEKEDWSRAPELVADAGMVIDALFVGAAWFWIFVFIFFFLSVTFVFFFVFAFILVLIFFVVSFIVFVVFWLWFFILTSTTFVVFFIVFWRWIVFFLSFCQSVIVTRFFIIWIVSQRILVGFRCCFIIFIQHEGVA